MDNISEMYFSGEDLSKCLREAADWIEKNDMKYRIRVIFSEYDDEWLSWYVNVFVYGGIK